MGKLLDNLQFQLTTDKSNDAKECLALYDILLKETGFVWESHWHMLTNCKFIGQYPKYKREYELNQLGKLVVKGYNCNNNNMKKYRKKPVVIEAVQWNGKNFDECMNFIGETCSNKIAYEDYEEQCINSGEMTIRTLEGDMVASNGDYIIKGINGEFYPCKPDIFDKTYEEVIE